VRRAVTWLLALTVAACAAPAQPDGPGEPTTLRAAVAQFREDEVRDQIRVRLAATAPVRVATLRLEWAGLPELPPTAPRYRLAPGVAVDLPVPLGPAACGDPPRADAPVPPVGPTDVTAVVGVAGRGGVVVEERVPVSDPDATLARVFARACREQALAALVSAQFGPRWEPSRRDGVPVLAGSMDVQRLAATGPVAVTGIDGSVLLEVVPVSPPPWVMDTGSGALSVPVAVTSTGRCDGHALGESKQTYVFDVLVDVAGQAGLTGPQPLTVEAPAALRDPLWATMLAACAAATDDG
jgi:hypothetical protein